jgi:hypothetical protein
MLRPRPIRIQSGEDDAVFRQGLATILGAKRDMVLVGQESTAVDASS